MTKLATMVEVAGEMRKPHGIMKTILAGTTTTATGATISTMTKESREIVHRVPHGEAPKKTTIAHGKGALDGTTAALHLQIERQETTWSSFVVVGVRVTMVHDETVIHETTILTKTTIATMDGETII